MNILIKEIEKLPKFLEYNECVKNKISPIVVSGLSSVGKIQLIEATKQYSNKNICIVTYNEIQARKIIQDLKYFTNNVIFFPKREIAPYDYEAESKDLPYERIETLNKIFDQTEKKKSDIAENKLIIVTTVEAIMQKMISKEEIYKNVLEFKTGKTFNLEELKHTLSNLGYERAEIVDGKGQFCVRGGIVDIGTTKTQGIRIEFWGDEVDSIRSFSITSQRSNKMLENAKIYPSHELILTKNIEDICKQIEQNRQEDVSEDIEEIKAGNYINKIDKYFNSFYDEQACFLDYIQNDYLLLLDDIDKINTRQDNIVKDNFQLAEALQEKGRTVPDSIKNIEKYNLENTDRQTIYLYETDLLENKRNTKFSRNVYNFKYRDMHFFKSELNILTAEIKKALEAKKKVFVLAGNEAGAKKIETLLAQEDIKYKYFEKLDDTKEQIYTNSIQEELKNKKVIISNGSLSAGFENYDLNMLVVTGEDFISSEQKRKRATDSFKQGEKVVFADLRAGDYVVHRSQGIGIYIGVNTITTADGVTKDYIKIKYKNDDVLYVPTDMLDNIRKFVGGGEAQPRLNKLGSKEWEHTKLKVKSNLKEVARDLIELYARRQKAKGFMFSKDTPWQKQFEDSFKYTETNDQLRCISEVKKDMESNKPMDRLLCGDVGYGKTEVAIRAAFKAVMDQKQVAYLVPTTILANQQYEEFKSRMEDFAINVELLNRFRTKKEQEEVIRRLKLGEVDIVIGTHRILSKDIVFKDLGLLIVDEEQRFGVEHKERIKMLKSMVDVLTLTATPIPRTLQMALSGLRDLSLIETPPKNRLPIQTYVLESNDSVIREAINREMGRGGQVFYLLNRISELDHIRSKIHKLVPKAKIGLIHGRMEKEEIENELVQFLDKNYDILICTTIIETGIDIPNANTLIIERADILGLSQLYQIRGRVGRGERLSYAYLMYDKNKIITSNAAKRLEAIKEFTELGSGYKIAMRDLAIRGSGDILGSEQSGYIDAVGMDLYMKLLNEAINEEKGLPKEEDNIRKYHIDVSRHVDEKYVEDDAIRIEIHQSISKIKSREQINMLIKEYTDRYGKLSEQILLYMKEKYLEYLLKKLDVESFKETSDEIKIVFDEDISSRMNATKLFDLSIDMKLKYKFDYRNKRIIIKIDPHETTKSYIYGLVNYLEAVDKNVVKR